MNIRRESATIKSKIDALKLVFGIPITALTTLSAVEVDESKKLSFNYDIRPILADNCYDCHGPDEEGRKAELRLDTPEGAYADRDGSPAIVPGDTEESLLIWMINAEDEEDIMPPPDSHRRLTEHQKLLLEQWIEEGAPFERHWAFVPPVRDELPATQTSDWARNPIDQFVLSRLEEENLKPSSESDRYTLVRRLYLDLIGLPPTPEQADAFVNDASPEAYERLVDELLESPRYGERWARPWLDLARYADTNGYEKDRPRSIWPYRDWVVEAINADMPFDQFSIEQLAGDMLPNATRDQRIATGFHRNTMINEEGGIDPLEYRYYSMVDRVGTTGAVWMGLSTACAQCHTHKYDPITHTDYFSLMALLDNADEIDLDVPTPEVEQQQRQLEEQIAALENEAIDSVNPEAFLSWLDQRKEDAVSWKRAIPIKAAGETPMLSIQDDQSIYASGDFNKREVYRIHLKIEEPVGKTVTAIRLDALPDNRLPNHGPGVCYYEGRRGDFFLSELDAFVDGRPVEFAHSSMSYGNIGVGSGEASAANVLDGEGSSGWSVAGREGEAHHIVLNLAEPLATPCEVDVELLFERHFVASLGRFAFSYSTDSKQATASPSGMPDPLVASDDEMKAWYIRQDKQHEAIAKQLAAVEKKMPRDPATLIMRERPANNPRATHRRHRGEYLNVEEEVRPAVPAIFTQLPENQPANRLSLARWLVSEDNPLVARVAVNRAWQALFGRGLMKSADDFGTQSEPPSHPRLLDWLAVEFMENSWSRKRLHRLIVTSATYRQRSDVPSELLETDPQNILLARGPRFRLDGEVVRDLMLAASGLLSTKMGGPGVYPPQPESVTALAYGDSKWPVSEGEDRYRRSLYTFAKRTAPFAAYAVFDAPSGENCVAKRDRSNSPLQALTLLNDAMFIEMAKAAASEAMTSRQENAAIATDLFRRFLTRPPSEEEMFALLAYFEAQQERFRSGEINAAALLGEGESAPSLAAWTLVARALMNLDETITKG